MEATNNLEKLKLVVTGTPHIRSSDSVSEIMLDVIIALLPAAVMAAFYFGVSAIIIMIVSICSSVLFEYSYQKVFKKNVTISDLSAAVTGLLLAFNLPASVPFWLPIVGSFFAIVLVKQLFGGLGQNFLNPALAARAFLLASYPSQMTNYFSPDGVASPTPLSFMKTATDATIINWSDILSAFIGTTKSGCLGETCIVALLLGGIYLILRKVISWRIPFFYIATVSLLSFAFYRPGMPVYDLMLGGLMLGAFFMATDYSSSPITPMGKMIFAVGCGVLTMVIRTFSKSYPEGVSYSILLMNLVVPIIDRFTRPKVFGGISHDE